MKKLLSLYYIFILISYSFGQNNSPENEEFNASYQKLLIGLNASPNIAGFAYHQKDKPFPESLADKNREVRLGFSGGLSIIYRPIEKLMIETGVAWSIKGYGINEYTRSESTGIKKFFEERARVNTTYIDIPIKLGYVFPLKRGFMSVSGGAEINIPLLSWLSAKDFESGRNDDFSDTEISGLVSFIYAPKVGKRISLKVEPIIRYSITGMRFEQIHPYSFGANLGMYYSLFK